MTGSDAVHDDAVHDGAGHDDDSVHDDAGRDAVHEVLRDWVKDVYAPADLAGRAESVARRRRTARRSVTSAVAVVALGTTIGTFAANRSGGATTDGPAARAVAQHSLTCAAKVNAYVPTTVTGSDAESAHTASPPMPDDPSGALLCRYAGHYETQPAGSLAGKAMVTDPVQLAKLQRAMNSGNLRGTGAMSCGADDAQIAIVLISYPEPPTVRTVRYERACDVLIGDFAARFAGSGFDQLVTAWTGDWQSTAIIPSR